MSLAEKKMQLMEFLFYADEETTGKLVEFTRHLGDKNQQLSEAVELYEKRNEDFIVSGEKGLSKEESLQLLRKQIK